MKKRILFVDDEMMLRQTMELVLKQAGYYVTAAENGGNAIHHLQSQSFDVVILDLHLPDMDGFQLMGEVKRIAPKTPVIMMTGDRTPGTAAKAMKNGAINFLFKPVSANEIIAGILLAG